MIEHLVLSGAGTNGLVQLGILNYLVETNVFNISNIKSIYATSAGAIISILMLTGVTIEEIKDYIIKRPWEKFFNLNLDFNENGIFSSKYLFNTIDPFMKAHDIPNTYTLLDLYNKTGVDLHVFTTKINGMVLTDLNHITHPGITLQEVITLTACVPIIFTPVKYENDYYIDGGLVNKCPLQSIDKCNYDPNTVLIIDIISKIALYNDETSIIDFMHIVFENLIHIVCSDSLNKTFVEKYKNYYSIIAENVNNGEVWRQFINNNQYRQRLYDDGYNYLKKNETKLEIPE